MVEKIGSYLGTSFPLFHDTDTDNILQYLDCRYPDSYRVCPLEDALRAPHMVRQPQLQREHARVEGSKVVPSS